MPVHLPNLERAAALLDNMPALWTHPGTTDEQRETLVRELLERAYIKETKLVAIEPRPMYLPLFAYLATEGVRNGRGERI